MTHGHMRRPISPTVQPDGAAPPSPFAPTNRLAAARGGAGFSGRRRGEKKSRRRGFRGVQEVSTWLLVGFVGEVFREKFFWRSRFQWVSMSATHFWQKICKNGRDPNLPLGGLDPGALEWSSRRFFPNPLEAGAQEFTSESTPIPSTKGNRIMLTPD